MKPGAARRTALFTSGHKNDRGLASQRISATKTPVCSVPSARCRCRAGDAFCQYLRHAKTSHGNRRAVAPGACAVLLMDRAGWHNTGEFKMPKNIIPIFLPSRSPELNPVENIWQFMRDNWLSNRIFEDYEAIVDACCDAWMRLMERPWKIMSIGLREWAFAG